jgi:hypothetical protein
MTKAFGSFAILISFLLAGCFIVPPVTGDGCPWGGCKDDGHRIAHFEPTLAPKFDPFVEGSHYRAGPYNAFLIGGRLQYRDHACEYDAVEASDVSSASEGGWRGPPASLQRIYRVERVGSGCAIISVGDLLRVAAVGQSQVMRSDMGEQLWLGPVTADRPTRILSRT